MFRRRPRARLLAVLAALPVLAPGCAPPAPDVDPAEHAAAVEEWRADRLASLRAPDGWLSLVGLYWLEPGENSFGSDSANALSYAGSGEAAPVPPRLGVFRVDADGSVLFRADPGVEVLRDGTPVDSVVMRLPPDDPAGDTAGAPPVLTWGPLSWYVIVRGDRLGVRLKSAESDVLTGFEGIDHFPVTTAWRVEGRLEPYDPPKPILVPSILGGENETPARAAAVFELDGETYRLDLWEDSDDPSNHFTAFGDGTNGLESYGAGRFLWIDAPAPGDDRIVIDFNRAYNPPCVFTPYATCPLPPSQNRLPFRVEAGEKVWGEH